MKKKLGNNKLLSKTKLSEQRFTNYNNILLNNEFGLILHNFYDSFYRYIHSMKKSLKEINTNISNNSKIYLDESSKKCLSSLNVVISYLDTSFSQFYSNMLKSFEKININKNTQLLSTSHKESNKLKNSASATFLNDNNYPNNSIYNNYKKKRLENKNNLTKNILMNTTTDVNKKENSINEIFGLSSSKKEYSQSRNKNNNMNCLNDENMCSHDFIENIKNLLNLLEYEKIRNINNNKKTIYLMKLGKYKDNLISEISNSINDSKVNNSQHRRINSFNLNSNSINYINNIYNEKDYKKNRLKDYIIQEKDEKNIKDLTNKKSNDFKESNKSLILNNKGNLTNCLSERNLFENNNKNNLNIINNIKININKDNLDNITHITRLENQKIKNEKEKIEKNKKDLLMQIADLITKNNTLTEEISILKNANKKFSETGKKTNEIIIENNKKIESLTNNKNELEKNNQHLKKKIELYTSEIDKLKKEIKKLNDYINNIEKENKNYKKLNKELTQENKNLQKETFELDKEIEQLKNQLNKTNSKKEEYEEKYRKMIKSLNDEKEMNILFEQKIKKLEKKLEENNINEFDDDNKTKTYKANNMNKVNEIEVEKLSRKYLSPYNNRKNTSVISTNNTSNIKKIFLNNNLDDYEITPDNYIIVKCFQLNNNLKWYLLKKIRKQSVEIESSPIYSPSQSNSKQFRRYKYLKINSKLINESFSDYVWKPSRNDKDFINFNYIINDNDNNKNENSNSIDKQKKINELECCIKDLEEKLEKKENDCNRINLNFAKMFKKSKHPEMNYDAVLENNEKLKTEIRDLKKKIEILKTSKNFIEVSFIEDDLEGSRFIDDKCFEEILDELVGNTTKDNNNFKKSNTYKRTKNEKKFEINMMKFFRSHEDDDNENKYLNKDYINIENNKEDLNELNNDDNINTNTNINNNIINRKNTKTSENNLNKDENNKNKDENIKNLKKYKFHKYEINNDNKKEKIISDIIDCNKENQSTKKADSIKTDTDRNEKNEKNEKDEKNEKNEKNEKSEKSEKNEKNDNKKFLSYRFTRYKHRISSNQVENKKEHRNTDCNNKNDNKNENIDSKERFLRKVNFQHDKKETTNNNNNFNFDYKNEEIRFSHSPKRIIENKLNKKTENEDESEIINKNIFINQRKIGKTYRRFQNKNNETDCNKNIVEYEEKNKDNIKEDKKDSKPYKSVKTIKIGTDNKLEKKRGEGLQESSSQSNRVCFGRRFFKKKKDDLNQETNEK